MFDKLKQKIVGFDIKLASDCAPSDGPISRRAVYQNREIFGVNFGSLFVLEKYIYGEMFENGGGDVELDAIKRCGNNDNTKSRLEAHWENYCSDSDWEWLKSKGVNSVRIPIGYWHVDPRFTHGTHFEPVKDVYFNAWKILKEKYIQKASQYGISVLVDLHALPFGANTGDHSGEKLSQAGFWSNSKARQLALDAIKFISEDLQQFDNISGLQIVNESVFDNEAKYQKRYYLEAINVIRSAGWHDIPIVISDGWWTEQWVSILDGVAPLRDVGKLGVVIDHHVYRCFSDEDKAKDIDGIINDLQNDVVTGLCKPVDIFIGEYSCVIDGQTWDKSHCNRDQKVAEYGQRQSQLFKERTMGSYFWTFKFQWGDGGEWGFVPMVNKGAIPTRATQPRRVPDKDEFERISKRALENHSNYWNSQSGSGYEHWRFQDGFTTGWNDCLEFLKIDNSTIGRLVAWKSTRMQQHVDSKGKSCYLWQWEHGFDEAVHYFKAEVC